MKPSKSYSIKVCLRGSPLSRAQLKEVQELLPNIELIPHFVTTIGDKDKKTSLRELEKTNFFTKEIDEALLQGLCGASLHSAKDLPEPLADGLQIAAITEGVDSSDSLVLRKGETLQKGFVIATSSKRRQEVVDVFFPGLQFADLRGTIGERLQKLEEGAADGVVIAEAALIRLGLTHLNRIKMPGKTTPLQGKLALVIRKGDLKMLNLFASLDENTLSRT